VTAKALAAIAAATAIAALLLPGAAAAQGRPPSHHNPTVSSRLALRGTNGFGIEVALLNRRRLSVSASASRGRGLVLTNYTLTAPQPRGSNGIKASLGKLGRIDLRFVPEEVEEKKPFVPVCDGEKTRVELGHFVGLIEFRGEHGYTRVRATRAGGGVVVEPAPSCRAKAKHAPHKRGRAAEFERRMSTLAGSPTAGVHLAELTVSRQNPQATFSAFRASFPAKGKQENLENFVAGAARDRGRIKEESSALDLLVSGPYFHVPDLSRPTHEAVLEPPGPFLGGATLQRESAHQVSWLGDLRVNLPGFGVVPLTGPGTDVKMCADSGCRPPGST
jgi:hypothetical protein